MTKLATKKIAYLLTTMGYGNQLLYWEPILREFTRHAPHTRIYLNEHFEPDHDTSLPIDPAIRFWRFTLKARAESAYNRIVTLVDPRIIYRLWKHNPDVLIVSEFGMLTLYGILASLLRPRCRLLLLVESDPGTIKSVSPRLRRLVCRFADQILTNNDAGESYLLTTLKVAKEKIRKAPYLVSQPHAGERAVGADAPEIMRSPYFGGDHLKFLYVGQIAARKGLEYMIRAAAALPSPYRDSLRIAIVGGGNPEEKDKLTALAQDLRIGECIHFLGRSSYAELQQIYESCDIFVFPTLNDYRALVGFEAICHGLPVLMSKYDGAAREVVDNGENGWIIDPLDIADFSDRLKWFVDNRDRLPAMGQRSKGLSEAFSVENAARSLADAASACLESSR